MNRRDARGREQPERRGRERHDTDGMAWRGRVVGGGGGGKEERREVGAE